MSLHPVALLVFVLLASTAGAAERPNLLFIFSDDHATAAIGAYGSQINQTPNLDRLASEGALFRNSFCANSICGPSRACILSGKHSHKNGFMINGDHFDGHQTTFPPLLQKAGYQTAVIGKWHLGTDPVGFDYWEVLPGQGSYYNPAFLLPGGKRHRRQGYCTDLITDMAIEWLDEGRDKEKPFLLMCQHKAPHRNWAPAPRHLKTLNDGPIPEPSTLRDDYAGRTELLAESEMTIRDHMHWGHDMKFKGENQLPEYFVTGYPNGEYQRMTPEQRAGWDAHYEPRNQAFLAAVAAGEMTDEEIFSWTYQRYIKDYLRCIAAVDESVGRLLDYLDQAGLADNTLVVYSSDQGFYLGEHGWYDKRWMFEPSLEMPLLVRWPGVIEPGLRPEAMVQNIDYGPTLLEAAGVEKPAEMQGESFAPILRGETPADWRDAIYYAFYESQGAHKVAAHDGVRTDRYKLMHFPKTDEWQLFDLRSDPEEMTSVHDDPSHAEVLAGMKQRYEELRATYEVPEGLPKP
ncbi:Arylsulfatase [Botrimarina colliarenosi]|uniref:Arylsulfatase n=1 Tax=Botrimarina colliarenosi TaxID=2528001 RepID=A0A5C6AC37_9BACT|nr:sulfatase [Botrimarina colliarenosi]TWT96695.1 Arylsulfatase [Botrimarina colliarenosi]